MSSHLQSHSHQPQSHQHRSNHKSSTSNSQHHHLHNQQPHRFLLIRTSSSSIPKQSYYQTSSNSSSHNASSSPFFTSSGNPASYYNWQEPVLIEDEDLMFDGQPLNELYEKNRCEEELRSRRSSGESERSLEDDRGLQRWLWREEEMRRGRGREKK